VNGGLAKQVGHLYLSAKVKKDLRSGKKLVHENAKGPKVDSAVMALKHLKG
jgi:hypothetical protein